MPDSNTVIAVIALILSAASFVIAQISAMRARKAEAIKELLGDKETVAFAALRLLREGFSTNDADRSLTLAAVMQACVFEGSDRSRALLYRVLDDNKAKYGSEISAAFQSMEQMFKSMDEFEFTKEELDLKNGQIRLGTVKKVLSNSSD